MPGDGNKRSRGGESRDGASSSSLMGSDWGGEGSSKRPRMDVVSHQETNVHALSAKLEWRIDQFEKLMKLFRNGQNIISNQFMCEQARECIWELHVYPNGKREEDLNYVSFFLRQVGLQHNPVGNLPPEPIMTEFQIYCIDNSAQRVSVCRDTKDFTHQQGRGKFQVTREKMQQAIRNDGDILLVCDVEYFAPGSKLMVEERTGSSDSLSGRRLGNDMETPPCSTLRLLREQLLTDTVIKVGETGDELRVHRSTLALHSPVFLNMFENEHMVEARDGVIRIHDASYDAIRALVEYMYTPELGAIDTREDDSTLADTDDMENKDQSSPFDLHAAIDTNTQQILAIADKYAVLPLKLRCERVLSRRLTHVNVCEFLLFGDTYSCKLLKQACVAQLRSEHTAVLATDEWKSLKMEHPGLANQLLESIVCGHEIEGDKLVPGTSATVRVVNERIDNIKLETPPVVYQPQQQASSSHTDEVSASSSRRNPPRSRKAAVRGHPRQ